MPGFGTRNAENTEIWAGTSLRIFVLPGFSLNFPIPTAGLNSDLPKPVGAIPPQGIELSDFVPLTGRKTQRFAGSRTPDAEP